MCVFIQWILFRYCHCSFCCFNCPKSGQQSFSMPPMLSFPTLYLYDVNLYNPPVFSRKQEPLANLICFEYMNRYMWFFPHIIIYIVSNICKHSATIDSSMLVHFCLTGGVSSKVIGTSTMVVKG